jgi:hypothetical protein
MFETTTQQRPNHTDGLTGARLSDAASETGEWWEGRLWSSTSLLESNQKCYRYIYTAVSHHSPRDR